MGAGGKPPAALVAVGKEPISGFVWDWYAQGVLRFGVRLGFPVKMDKHIRIGISTGDVGKTIVKKEMP